MMTPRKPSGPSLATISWGNSWRASNGAILSPSSASANWRATSRICCCSGVSSKSTSHRRANVLANEAHDVLRRGARREQLLDAHRLQRRDVLRGNDAAAEHGDVAGALLGEQLEHALEEVVVRSRQDGEADRVRVFLNGRRDDLLRRLVETRV